MMKVGGIQVQAKKTEGYNFFKKKQKKGREKQKKIIL